VQSHEQLIAELSRLLAGRGLSVRSEPLWGQRPGGQCRLNGKVVVLLNTKALPLERLIVLADYVVANAPLTEALSIEARALIQRRMARRSDVVAPATAARPGLAKGASAGRRRRRI
jgi:hypothetical protein